MKKLLNYIQSENFHIELSMIIFLLCMFAYIFCLCSNPTASRPEPKPQQNDEQLKAVSITVPAGYSEAKAIKEGKVLEIIWN